MIRSKAFSTNWTDIPEISPEISPESDDQLLLIDDAMFVSAFVQGSARDGKQQLCMACCHPARPLHAVLLLLDTEDADECAGSAGFCLECYRDLSERMFHDAVLRASRQS